VLLTLTSSIAATSSPTRVSVTIGIAGVLVLMVLSPISAVHAGYRARLARKRGHRRGDRPTVAAIVVAMLVLGWVVPPLAFSHAELRWHTYVFNSGSMLPTIRDRDWLVAAEGPGAVFERGDVVVTLEGDVAYMRRLIGLPGDAIEMKEGRLFLNHAAVPRREAGTFSDPRFRRIGTVYIETIDGQSFETLDLHSDSRGDNTQAITVPEGHVFMLGDNRDNANDSRFIGPVPISQVIGKAQVIYWSPARKWLPLAVR
jgi:signal peptidase I